MDKYIIYSTFALLILCLGSKTFAHVIGDDKIAYFHILLSKNEASEPSSLVHGTHEAVEQATKKIIEEKLMDVEGINITVTEINCTDHAVVQAANVLIEGAPQVFLGPSCDMPLDIVARNTHFLQVPTISTGGWFIDIAESPQAILDRHVIRASGSNIDAAKSLRWLIKNDGHTSWSRAGLLYRRPSETAPPAHNCYHAIQAVYHELLVMVEEHVAPPTDKLKDNIPYMVMYQHNIEGQIDYAFWLKRVTKKSKIVVMCVDNEEQLRGFMLAAHDLQMTGGDYVFIQLDYYSIKSTANWHQPWRNSDVDEGTNQKLKEAFKRLLVLSVNEQPMNSSLARNLKTYVNNDNFNYFVACYHDAVLLYAQAFDEVQHENKDPSDLKNIYTHMIGQTLHGASGLFTIGSDGTRKAQYGLYGMNSVTFNFELVSIWDSRTLSYIRNIHGREFFWGNQGDAPENIQVPKCGFDTACPTAAPVKSGGHKVAVTILAVLLILAIAVIIVLVVSRIRNKSPHVYRQHVEQDGYF